MAQITIPTPNLPSDWHSTALGILGAFLLLIQQYAASGSITYEKVAIAVFVAVLGYLIPAKTTPVDQAKMVDTVAGIVTSTLGAKVPAALTTAVTVPLEQSILTAVQSAVSNLQAPAVSPEVPVVPAA